MPVEIGTKGSSEAMVTPQNTAVAMGSGTVPVFATPCMVALMENAASLSVQPFLCDEETTVGIQMDVSHTSATPIGMKVHAESILTAVEGKKLCFHVIAYDENGEIGQGIHQRMIVSSNRFLEKANKKLHSDP